MKQKVRQIIQDKGLKLYFTQEGSNGTNDLLVVDRDGEIVSHIDTALFAARASFTCPMGRSFVPHGDSVIYIDQSELDDDLEESLAPDEVFETEIDQVLVDLAVSPVRSYMSALRTLIQTIRETR